METVGGYRLVRMLGEGERAQTWLGHAGSLDERVVAIKIFRPWVPSASISDEVEALARASSPHLLRLDDLATDADGRTCLILQRLQPAGLSRLVAARGRLEPGEAVTALAPLVMAVAELHRVGVAHGQVRLSSALLDDRGAPVLAAFGAATLIGSFPSHELGSSLTPAQLASDLQVHADRQGLAELTKLLLSRQHGARTLLEWLDSEPEWSLAQLAERVFDLAPATAINPVAPARPRASSLRSPGEPGGVGLSAVDGAGIERDSPGQPRPVALAALALPEWLEHAVDSSPVAAIRARLVAALGRVRRGVWIAGGAGLAALVVAFTLVPAPSSPGADAVETSSSSRSTKEPAAQPKSTGAVAGDDPTAATDALVAMRTDCISRMSLTCLDSADQPGSALLESDRVLVRRLKDGGAGEQRPLDGRHAVVLQRLGDSAILALEPDGTESPANSSPVSLLVVRGETGWRIRDLMLG